MQFLQCQVGLVLECGNWENNLHKWKWWNNEQVMEVWSFARCNSLLAWFPVEHSQRSFKIRRVETLGREVTRHLPKALKKERSDVVKWHCDRFELCNSCNVFQDADTSENGLSVFKASHPVIWGVQSDQDLCPKNWWHFEWLPMAPFRPNFEGDISLPRCPQPIQRPCALTSRVNCDRAWAGCWKINLRSAMWLFFFHWPWILNKHLPYLYMNLPV